MLEHAALRTDLYQLTMAQAHYDSALRDAEAAFHLFFRTQPFGSGYVIACGIESALESLRGFAFAEADIAFLESLRAQDGSPLFRDAFLRALSDLRLSIDVDAVREGTAVFAHEPIVRVRGRAFEAQLVETLLLNTLGFESLVATKAARICEAAADDPVLEFGLRRAQGPNGGLSASRAAFIGGCTATSNVLAAQRYGIPVRGTHAHAWVMLFDEELEAFRAYADSSRNNCTLLVDTFDTLEGVRNAIRVGHELRAKGQDLAGVRLDSGDLAELSKAARLLLDDAGFFGTKIVASNDLDEHLITSLKRQGARIDVWGVGTKLVTAYDAPALGVVYKLGAVRRAGGAWTPRVKVSEQAAKVSTPGVLNVSRYIDADGIPLADVVYDELIGPGHVASHVHDITRQRDLSGYACEPLLEARLRAGEPVRAPDSVFQARDNALRERRRLAASVRRFENPQEYFIGLEARLFDQKVALVREARARSHKG